MTAPVPGGPPTIPPALTDDRREWADLFRTPWVTHDLVPGSL